ncbi:MAG: chromate transporter [Kiritimatiellae bacterium]|nr:chromate transporter [Kiritimatiellia bacterium]
MATGWQLFISFLKIGAMLFGGGYAMLPLLEREVVNRRGWCAQEEMTDFYAMAQLVPGVIAVNTAMLIGHRLRGLFGTVMATLGVVCVPFLIILAYGIVFDTIADISVLKRAMAGLRPAVAGMMLGTAWTLFKRTGKTRLGVAVTLTVLALSFLFHVNAVALILAGIAGGILWWLVTYLRLKGKEGK